jgi:hypothetical protein
MDSLDKNEYLFREKPGRLIKGLVHEKHFRLLIEVSNIRSTKVIYALEGYLVNGRCIKDVCADYGITTSYFSSVLRRIQEISSCVYFMMPYYKV